MDKVKILERELRALGAYYRNDWSGFDGRSLRSQIDSIFDWFNDDTKQQEFTEYSEDLARQ